MNQAAPQPFSEWAIVEIMGHDRYAGHVSEQVIGGASFVRIDVPEIDDLPRFTKLFGAGAIFSITPVTEEVAKVAVKRMRSRPIAIAGFSQQSLGFRGPEEEFDDLNDG